jgi:hypothetical protein
MSRIALSPNAAGTATYTVAAPGTNTDRTLTLPDDSGTILAQDASGIVTLPAASPQILSNNAGALVINAANAAGTVAFRTAGAERARIDSAGNFGVNASNIAYRFQVNGISGATAFTGTIRLGLGVGGSTGATDLSGIDFFGNVDTLPKARIAVLSNNFGSYLRFGTSNNYAAGITNTAMTIDELGKTSLGGTLVGPARLNVYGTGTNDAATWSVIMYDSSGNQMFSNRNDGSLYMGLRTGSPFNLTTATAANTVLLGDGYMYRSTSSLKYKTDVNDAWYGLPDLMKLRAVTYKGKGQSDGDKVFGGLIAEEVHAAGLTEFVQYAEDGTPDALAYSHMVSLCVKAIQQQQEIIESLKSRITALESK